MWGEGSQSQTGSYVLTSLVAPPLSFALTTLAAVQAEIPGFDATRTNWVSAYAIPQVSAQIARHCNRIFGLATWMDVFHPQRGVWGEGTRGLNNPLKLTRWPVALQPPVAFAGDLALSNQLVQNIASTAGLVKGMPIYGAGVPAGATIGSVQPSSLMLSAPATVAGLQVALTAGLNVVETIAGVATTLVYGTDFEIDAGSLMPGDEGPARLFRLDTEGSPRRWPATKIAVVYQAGYSLPGDAATNAAAGTGYNLPTDIEQACLRLVTARLRAAARDPMLVSRDQPNVGNERYWVGNAPGQTGQFPPEIERSLDRYRVPVVA